MSGRRAFPKMALLASLVALSSPASRASADEKEMQLVPGMMELGIAASSVTIQGSTQAMLALRLGTFLAAPAGLLGFEAETGWTHVRSYDALDMRVVATWGGRAGSTSLYPFVAALGGVRQEWVGSFRETRYPLGGGVGVRALVAEHAIVRAEWRGVRVLDDPVNNPFEHGAILGISLLFGG